MPEEINRVLTDQISDLLFTTEKSARDNLAREGIAEGRIHFVGNVMIDTLRYNLQQAVPAAVTLSRYGRSPEWIKTGFAAITLHRPSNVDDPDVLRQILEAIAEVSLRLPIVFPMHPRTRARIEQHGLNRLLEKDSLAVLPPLGYLEMLGLMQAARLVLTDSGGIQEETTALGIPCITLRDGTERPITVDEGTNTVVGHDPKLILSTTQEILWAGGKAGRVPELWDGRAAKRIVEILGDWLNQRALRMVA
jgi:UDP-N-acetylglucosamine 2-epimerase (non-hydrolysing)